MNFFLRLGSSLFHPLWIPTLATLYYYWLKIPPFPIAYLRNKLLLIVLLTLVIPAAGLALARATNFTAKFTESSLLGFRNIQLLFWGFLLITVNRYVVATHFPELFYFNIGLLLSIGLVFLLGLINFNIDLHSNCFVALVAFIFATSFVYQLKPIGILSFSLFALGWLITAELAKKKHSLAEVLGGLATGILPQLLLLTKLVLIHRI